LLFDSLGVFDKELVGVVRNYVETSWLAAYSVPLADATVAGVEHLDAVSLPCYAPTVQLQELYTDSGSYMLAYADYFLRSPGRFRLDQPAMLEKTLWIPLEVLHNMRAHIRNAIMQLVNGGKYIEGVNILLDR
jgi:hypothetical protein